MEEGPDTLSHLYALHVQECCREPRPQQARQLQQHRRLPHPPRAPQYQGRLLSRPQQARLYLSHHISPTYEQVCLRLLDRLPEYVRVGDEVAGPVGLFDLRQPRRRHPTPLPGHGAEQARHTS